MSFKTNVLGVSSVVSGLIGSDVQAHDDLLDDIAALDLSGNASKTIIVNATNNGFELSTSPLGTAAYLDAGTAEGDVPLLSTGGKLDSGLLPTINVDSLGDVSVTTPVDNNILKYSSGIWVNGTIAYSEVTGTPTLATVATTGDYEDLTNKPTTNDPSFVKSILIKTDAGDVTVLSTAHVIIINKGTGEATQVTLPAGELNKTFIIKDGKGDASTNNITVVPDSGTIDGASSIVINQNYESVTLVYNGTQWNVI